MTRTPTAIEALSALPQTDFVALLGGIFENSPWVAERAYAERPFGGVDALHEAMCAAVAAAGSEAQLALLREHPDLAGRAALAGELTAASSAEQSGAGLDRLTEPEYGRFHDLNRRYRERFGFPFILAVKGHDKTSVLAAFERRLGNDADTERQTALEQVCRIARFRLEALAGAL